MFCFPPIWPPMDAVCQLNALSWCFSRHASGSNLTQCECQLSRELLPYTQVTTQEGGRKKNKSKHYGQDHTVTEYCPLTLYKNKLNMKKTNVSLTVACHEEKQSIMLDSV